MLQPEEDAVNRQLMYKVRRSIQCRHPCLPANDSHTNLVLLLQCHNTDCRGNGYKIPASHNCCYVSHVAHDVEYVCARAERAGVCLQRGAASRRLPRAHFSLFPPLQIAGASQQGPGLGPHAAAHHSR